MWTYDGRRSKLKHALKKRLSLSHPQTQPVTDSSPRPPPRPHPRPHAGHAAPENPGKEKKSPRSHTTLVEFENALDDVETLAPSSRQLYKERMRSIAKATGKADDFEWCLAHPQETWDALKKVRIEKNGGKPLSDQTLRASASAMVALFRHAEGAATHRAEAAGGLVGWQALLKESAEVAQEKYEDIAPSDKQREAHIEWEELIRVRDRLIKAANEGVKDEAGAPPDSYLILSLLTFVPPSRADWGAVRVYRTKDEPPPTVGSDLEKTANYIVIENSAAKKGKISVQVVWNRYKTAKTYGRQVRELPEELVEVILASLKRKDRDKTNEGPIWLLTKRDGKPHSNHSFAVHVSFLLQKLFGRPATLDTIRHSFVNHARIWELTPKQMDALALDLRHSVAMMSRYRLNFGDKDNKGSPSGTCKIVCNEAKPR